VVIIQLLAFMTRASRFGRNVSEEIRAGRVTGEETRLGSRTSTGTFESLYEAALNTTRIDYLTFT